MRLHADTVGAGPPLVMLHGWGLHSGIWSTVLPRLQRQFRVTCIDLPGHGFSRGWGDGFDLTAAAAAVLEVAPPHAAWLGWSLGGQVALAAAGAHRERVASLVLVATTPRFVAGPDWPCGIAPELLADFSASVAANYRKTVGDFLALQVRGDSQATALLKILRDKVFERGLPEPAALASGLTVLAGTDLRRELHRLFMPALVFSGRRDRLTPAEAGRRMAATLPGGRFHLSPSSAHAPFLSHPEEFLGQLTDFLEEAA
ncbi:MAG: pimeloyl-ACP methyl ester esterase BioH [Gammaproteobacteria bacterium]